MKKTTAGILISVFIGLTGCVSTLEMKAERMNQYHAELASSDQTSVMRQFLYWQKAREEFPEYSDYITLIIDELIILVKHGNGSQLRQEDQETMDDIGRHFWFKVQADHGYIDSPGIDPAASAGLLGLGLYMMEQSRPQPLPSSGPVHCLSAYRPWGNGMIDTTCY